MAILGKCKAGAGPFIKNIVCETSFRARIMRAGNASAMIDELKEILKCQESQVYNSIKEDVVYDLLT